MPSTDRLDAGAARIAALVRAGARSVAIDGLGASGKSTLADRVAELVPDIRVVHLDDFTRPGAVGWERDRFVDQVWTSWTSGRPLRYQRHHWTQTEPTDWVEEPRGGVLLVEGIGSSEPPAGVHWDTLVWLAAPAAARAARAERRDPARFGCWSTTWRPIEDAWFTQEAPWRRADLVWVNT